LLQDLTKALVLPDELFCQEFFSLNELITLLDEDFFRRHHNEGHRPAANLKFVRQCECRDAFDTSRKYTVKSKYTGKVKSLRLAMRVRQVSNHWRIWKTIRISKCYAGSSGANLPASALQRREAFATT
jgi:hypothetical protein